MGSVLLKKTRRFAVCAETARAIPSRFGLRTPFVHGDGEKVAYVDLRIDRVVACGKTLEKALLAKQGRRPAAITSTDPFFYLMMRGARLRIPMYMVRSVRGAPV